MHRSLDSYPPKPVARIGQWARVSRNHRGWTYPYSVEVKMRGGSWGILSQHRTLTTAKTAARAAVSKYKSGSQALGFVS